MLMNELANATYQIPLQAVTLSEGRFPPIQCENQHILGEVDKQEVKGVIITIIVGKSVPTETLHVLVSHKNTIKILQRL